MSDPEFTVISKQSQTKAVSKWGVDMIYERLLFADRGVWSAEKILTKRLGTAPVPATEPRNIGRLWMRFPFFAGTH